MKEIWKDIEGYEGLYQVSNMGRVKRLEGYIQNKHSNNCVQHIQEKIKTASEKDGYLQLALYKDGTGKRYYIHRLVAEAFIENPENKQQVNHINGDKHDNRVRNLEWNTSKENVYHAIVTGLSKSNLINQECNAKPVMQYDKNMNFIKKYPSINEAERQTKINHSCISLCCRGRLKTSGGFVWKYE